MPIADIAVDFCLAKYRPLFISFVSSPPALAVISRQSSAFGVHGNMTSHKYLFPVNEMKYEF